MSKVELIRNIGVMAHIDAGKTTTTERVLFYTGKNHRLGEVDDGEATMDWMEQEQNRGITITSAVTTCLWQGRQINIIDTPGHVDFTVEVERSLRVLDGSVAIFCAVGGVEPQTETVWRQADHHGIPRLIYINKLDRVGADFSKTLQDIRQKLNAKPAVLYLPIGQGSELRGLIDILNNREMYWSAQDQGLNPDSRQLSIENHQIAQKYREDLLDTLSEFSDALLEDLLEGRQPEPKTVKNIIRQATLEQKITPVFCGASLKNIGVQPLLDGIIDYLPNPKERPILKGIAAKSGEPVQVEKVGEKDPALLLTFKIQWDREAGPLTFVRVYSGSVKKGQVLLNYSKKHKERVGRILRMHANRREDIDCLNAGDLGVIVGFKHTQTGDTLGSEGRQILLEKIEFPEPVISVAIEPKTQSEQDKLKKALNTLSFEDPSFAFKENRETGQLLISGMGELHLEVLTTRILKDYKVAARIGNPQVSYRESITKEITRTEKFHRVLAGKENSAVLTLKVGPTREAGNLYRSLVTEAELPREFLDAVARGVKNSFATGIILGYPAHQIEATLIKAEYDEALATAMAYEAAAALGFAAACRKAGPVLLEPIMNIDVSVPKEYLGEVIAGLNSRNGRVKNIESREHSESLQAEAPLARCFGYSTALRNATQGRGSFSLEFSHFAPRQSND